MMKKLYSATYNTPVLYEDYRVIVEARNKKEAKILAQAMRICKNVFDYKIKSITEMKAKYE
jgi:hypothetical protein